MFSFSVSASARSSIQDDIQSLENILVIKRR